ncbi:Branched-chain amino acid transport system permease protein LivM [Desulfosporosinus sp. I2]|uniref:branched-chain amino acid ABC transporter permease n=1 Tax=Desulfosporosinus sp. I2 TaxID=1617025 RepID=UPI00061EA858|nr:branched-chain amino acid ABC transporter permease [Desulfosporosinus sp. I2]KJR45448.1 Branched-chain amino acid transport system permease protein LivM [Desulfosporosinus sp. I2]
MLDGMKKSNAKLIAYGGFLAVAIAFPFISPNRYYLTVVTLGFIYAIAVYGLNLIVGYLGQLSLAQAGFFGLGAYVSGLLSLKLHLSFWISLPMAAVVTTLVALLVGLISFRTRGHYFVIFTLCIGVIINLVIEKWDDLTGGVRGLIGIPRPTSIGPIDFISLESQYYLVLFFLSLTIFVMSQIASSLVGRTFKSIRNSEELAATLGINVMRNKLLAFGIAAFFTGIAGALFAGYIRFIGPDISNPHLTFEFLLFLLIGGQATIAGPLVGTLIATGLTESLQFMQEYRMVVFGALLIIIVKFFPGGLVGAAMKLKTKIEKRMNKANKSVNAPSKGENHAAKNRGFN